MTTLGDDILESLTDALAHAKGECSGVRIHTVKVPAVKAITRKPHKKVALRQNQPRTRRR